METTTNKSGPMGDSRIVEDIESIHSYYYCLSLRESRLNVSYMWRLELELG